MKKILLLIIAPFAFLSALSAQITREEADGIVSERMSRETPPYTVYAKAEVQELGITVTTSAGEMIELDYDCWVYYVQYPGQSDENPVSSRYLIVKRSDGNLLEINAKHDVGPNDLAEWREVAPIEIPFTEYSLPGSSYTLCRFTGTSCKWTDFNYYNRVVIINDQEELMKYIDCAEGNSPPAVDFSKHTLLLTKGGTPHQIVETKTVFLQYAANDYELQMTVNQGYATAPDCWHTSILVPKIADEATVTLVLNNFRF